MKIQQSRHLSIDSPVYKRTILAALREIHSLIGTHRTRSICSFIASAFSYENFYEIAIGYFIETREYENGEYARCIQYLREIWKKWPKYSGHELYPVPMPHTEWLFKSIKSELAAHKFHTTARLWRGKYGKLRTELLEFTIAEIEKEIASWQE